MTYKTVFKNNMDKRWQVPIQQQVYWTFITLPKSHYVYHVENIDKKFGEV